MRLHPHFKLIITATALAGIAACAPYGRRSTSSSEISVRWDSGPLDRDYGRMHSDMISRHNEEIAHPRSDESVDVRTHRQAAETQDLELRYSRGKAAHSQSIPPSER